MTLLIYSLFFLFSYVRPQLISRTTIKNLWQLNNCCQNATCTIPYGCLYFGSETEIYQNGLNIKELCRNEQKYSKYWSRQEFFDTLLRNSDCCNSPCNGIQLGCIKNYNDPYLHVDEFCVDPPPPPFSPLNVFKGDLFSTPEHFSSFSNQDCCDLKINSENIIFNINDHNECFNCGVQYRDENNIAASYRVRIYMIRTLYFLGDRKPFEIYYNESKSSSDTTAIGYKNKFNKNVIPSLYIFEKNKIIKEISNEPFNEYCSPPDAQIYPELTSACTKNFDSNQDNLCCELIRITTQTGTVYKYNLHINRNFIFNHDKQYDAFIMLGYVNQTNFDSYTTIKEFEVYSQLMPPAPPFPPSYPPSPSLPPSSPPPPPSPPPALYTFPVSLLSLCKFSDVSCLEEISRFNYFGRNINSSPLNGNSNSRNWDKTQNTLKHLNSGAEKCDHAFPNGIDISGFCITTFYFPVCRNRQNNGCGNGEIIAASTKNLELFEAQAIEDAERGIYSISMRIKLINYGPQNGKYDNFHIIASHFDATPTGLEFLDRGFLTEKLIDNQIRTVQGKEENCDCFGISLPLCDLCQNNINYDSNKIISADLKIHASDFLTNSMNGKSSLLHIGLKISTDAGEFTTPGGTVIQILEFNIIYTGNNV